MKKTDGVCPAWLNTIREKVSDGRKRHETGDEQEKSGAAAPSELPENDIVWLKRLLSHNFRMPMAVIAGYGDLLREGSFESREECLMVIGRICKNIDYMNTMLQVLLNDDVNGTQSEGESFDLIGCIRLGMEYVNTIARKQGVKIQVNSAQPAVTMHGDRIRLIRAFFNLIENSLKYMKRAGVIHITVDKQEDTAYVMYKDDGEGVDEDEASRLTEWRYQGTNQESGYGLGMYLVREAVEDLGGTIEVRSRKDEGMGIYMTFPCDK